MSEGNYPADWDTRRQAVYERDDNTCQNCGRTASTSGELHAHHIVPIKNGGSHAKSNLVTMCEDCHNAIHNDTEAPTARVNPSSSVSVTNFEDMDEFNRFTKFLAERAPIFVATNIEDMGPKVLIQIYRERGAEVRKRTRQTKHQFLRFDPYDNPDSEYVDDEFKDTVKTYVSMVVAYCDQVLTMDRLFQKYVHEVTTVRCGGCDQPQPEQNSYCGECGTEISVLLMCSKCGTYRDSVSQDFCKSCGTDLNEYSDSRLNQIEITVSELASELEQVNDLLTEAKEFNNEELIPLWKAELR